MKKCFLCLEEKNPSEYHKHPQKKDGLHPTCKLCRKSLTKKQYKKHKEKIKDAASNYYHNNKDKVIASQREYARKKRNTDKSYVVARRLRNRLYYALKNKSWKKNTHFSDYIGCSREDLIVHLESGFRDGMSWDNYGKWHIDHVIPLNSATNEDSLYRLCHYTNLQPLWASDNIRKGDKIIGASKKDYTVKLIDNKSSHDLILNNHYAKRLPQIKYAYGLFMGKELVGVCTFAKPSGRHVASYISTDTDNVLELNRLVLKNNIKNEASILISKSIKLLPKNTIVVSFADTKQNHLGYVYQACNFKYFGTTLRRKEFQSDLNFHSSTLAKDPEKYKAKLGNRSIKHRYIYTKDYTKIKLEELCYPK